MSMKDYKLTDKTIGTAKVTVETLGKGHCIPNTKITAKYITVHNTDNWDAPSKNNHNYLKNLNKNGGRTASWHFTVDDIEIYQSQSTNYKCYHTGNTKGNNESIGIEICQFKDKNKQLKVYKNAIELIKILMKYHKFDIYKVVQHNYWSGKNCPSVLRAGTYGYDWNWFINQVKEESKPSSSNNQTSKKETYYRVIAGSYTKKSNAESTVNELKKKGYDAFISTFTKDNTLYYRAVVGSYSVRANADAQINKLKKDGYSTFIEVYKK